MGINLTLLGRGSLNRIDLGLGCCNLGSWGCWRRTKKRIICVLVMGCHIRSRCATTRGTVTGVSMHMIMYWRARIRCTSSGMRIGSRCIRRWVGRIVRHRGIPYRRRHIGSASSTILMAICSSPMIRPELRVRVIDQPNYTICSMRCPQRI